MDGGLMYQERMMGYYPQVIQSILEFQAIINGEYPEFEDLAVNNEQGLNDAFLSTMGEDRIAQWEQVLGIKPIEISTLSDRRDTIIARIRGQGKLNTALINTIVNTFTGGTATSYIRDSILYVEVTPPPGNKQYQFLNVEQELKQKVPAHLGFEISRNYFTWNEIKNECGTWSAVNAAFDTWEDVILFVPFNSKIVEVSGIVIKIADAITAPLQGLNIYGQTTRDEVPSLDTPVELVSVENPDVTICGKNLFSGFTKGIFINANTGAEQDYSSAAVTDFIPIDFTMSNRLCVSGLSNVLYSFVAAYDANKIFVGRTEANANTSIIFEKESFSSGSDGTKEYDKIKYVRITSYEMASVEGTDINTIDNFQPQLEYGNTITDFEPYSEIQTMDVPYTLHGIQVTEDGNYTDADGQLWLTDEIDFERGVYIQRLEYRVFDGTENYHIISTQENGLRVGLNWDGLRYPNSSLICSHLPNQREVPGITQGANASPSYYVPHDTLEGWSDYLVEQYANGTPMVVIVPLETPIETPLTDEELAIYQALYTNHPNTTIFNVSNAPMVVKYKQLDKRS